MMEDRELMASFLQGKASALQAVEGWIRTSANPFRRQLRFELEDCVQECLLLVTRALREERFRGDSSFKTYVWRIAGNTCISRLRRQRRSAHESLEELELPAAEESPLAETLRKEFGRIALQVFQQASEECRRLWAMILDGLSYDEMSSRSGVTAGALRVRVLRCRRSAWKAREELLGTDAGNKHEAPASESNSKEKKL